MTSTIPVRQIAIAIELISEAEATPLAMLTSYKAQVSAYLDRCLASVDRKVDEFSAKDVAGLKESMAYYGDAMHIMTQEIEALDADGGFPEGAVAAFIKDNPPQFREDTWLTPMAVAVLGYLGDLVEALELNFSQDNQVVTLFGFDLKDLDTEALEKKLEIEGVWSPVIRTDPDHIVRQLREFNKADDLFVIADDASVAEDAQLQGHLGVAVGQFNAVVVTDAAKFLAGAIPDDEVAVKDAKDTVSPWSDEEDRDLIVSARQGVLPPALAALLLPRP